jgi:Pycsar effector protein
MIPVNPDPPRKLVPTTPPAMASPEATGLAPSLLPDHPPLFRHLDPAAALAFRTPLQEHPPAADTKAAAILTALGIMFPLLAKFGTQLSPILWHDPEQSRTFGTVVLAILAWLTLLGFVFLALGALVQAFRTLSPRIRKTEPSLAFFGDIADLTRDEYIEKVSRISHEEALKNILAYNHNLSIICVEKFAHLAWAIRLFKWAFGCWFILIILIGIREVS